MRPSTRSGNGTRSGNATSLQDIAGESILLAGGGRAILMQIAHPGVGRGVAEHSEFAQHPLDRLHATMTYIYAVVYGSATEVAFVRKRVNLAHASVNGQGNAEAAAYDAYDPALQLWVAATLYATAIGLYELVFGRLDAESADRVYREYAVLGTTLQVPADLWPADRAAFRAYWDQTLTTLQVTDAVRRVARDLLRPQVAPLWLKAVMPVARLLTVGLLPAQLRAEFGLCMTARNGRRFRRWMRIMATVYPRLPSRIRHSMRDAELATLRRTIAAMST